MKKTSKQSIHVAKVPVKSKGSIDDYTHVIIADDRGKPMAWDTIGKQLCYCESELWGDDLFPVKIYSRAQAHRHIKTSERNRKVWGFSPITYVPYPVCL